MKSQSGLTLKGTIKKVLNERPISAKFKVQSIHLTIKNGNYPSDIEIDFVNDKIALLNGYMAGEDVEIAINITGNVSKNDPNKVFNSLRAWKIERQGVELTNATQNNFRQEANVADDSLAF